MEMPPGFFVTFITCKKYPDNIVCEEVAYNECVYFNGVKFDSLYATLCWHVRLIAEIRTQKCLPDNLHVFQLPFSKLYLHRSWWKLRIRKINLILVKLYQNISPPTQLCLPKLHCSLEVEKSGEEMPVWLMFQTCEKNCNDRVLTTRMVRDEFPYKGLSASPCPVYVSFLSNSH